MSGVIRIRPPRPEPHLVDGFAGLGSATVHEAMGRTGSLGPDIRPIQLGDHVAGTAVTVLCPAGDNLMIHAAVEQCEPGDVLVVAVTEPSARGMVGELLATSLAHRGVRGLVIDAGVRDTADLRAMSFPVWSRHVSVQGTTKSNAGSVNVPVRIDGQEVSPGDVIVADDDGVVCVPRPRAAEVLAASRARVEREGVARQAFERGELGLDRYGLRQVLLDLDVTYEPAAADDTQGRGA